MTVKKQSLYCSAVLCCAAWQAVTVCIVLLYFAVPLGRLLQGHFTQTVTVAGSPVLVTTQETAGSVCKVANR
jgi:hypothetical protein